MSEGAPVFVIVGRVNKGKSSIVANLTEDETVPIDEEPGTTRECRTYSVDQDGRVLFQVVDTPGFQDAPAALAEMRSMEGTAADRRAAVRQFVRDHKKADDFRDECRLLQPILDGGGILYVVDGGVPYGPDYEAEMEILRWTGQPRMALVNRIGRRDHTERWKNALGQYFSMVREFDANRVGFEERMRLLESFRELDERWRPRLEEAVRILRGEWDRRRREAARAIADLLVFGLTHRVEMELSRNEGLEELREEAEKRLREDLRKRERKIHERIRRLYRHQRLTMRSEELDAEAVQKDLFAEKTWTLLGLSHGQMILAGAAGGAGLGAIIDANLGGTSLMAGTVLGGLLGGGMMAYRSSRKLGSVGNVVKYLSGRRIARYGPVRHERFAGILLDRALLMYRVAAGRPHSVRGEADPVEDEASRSVVRRLSGRERRSLSKFAARLTKNADDVPDDLRRSLREWVETVLSEL